MRLRILLSLAIGCVATWAFSPEYPRQTEILGLWPLNGSTADVGPRKLHGATLACCDRFGTGPFGDSETSIVQAAGVGATYRSITSRGVAPLV